MSNDRGLARALYRRLLGLYPRGFRERLGESMEQTFDDLCERHERETPGLGFVVPIFVDTTIGIGREYILLFRETTSMRTTLANVGAAAMIGFLLLLPLMIMEVVNRREFNEGFPVALFAGLWLSLFALSLILLPLVRTMRAGNRGATQAMPEQSSTFLSNPKWAAVIAIALLLTPLLIQWLDTLAGLPLQHLMNGPNPDQPSDLPFLPGLFISLSIFFLPPVAAGLIASRPIVRTLRAGGSVFAHPVNLIIVVLIVAPIIYGLTTLIIDQWPCFIGVPNCD